MRRAIFLDKDGTLINDVPYNVDPEKISLQQYAVAALQLLRENDYLIIVISNQSGVALGYFNESALQQVNSKIRRLLKPAGIDVEAFYYCTHSPSGIVPEYSGACLCRKPAPGLIMKAAEELSVDLSVSWMIGDILDDVEAGNRAGCKTIHLNNGNETEWVRGPYRTPHYTVPDLKQAADIIISTA